MFTAIVERIHNAPQRFGLSITGAGGSAIAALMSVPGCSRTLIDANVPYACEASEKLLDYRPAQYLSPEVGRQLAQHAYFEAVNITGSRSTCVGIGASSAVQTSRNRCGEDAVYLSSWTDQKAVDYQMRFDKTLSREQQELLVASVIIKAMADSCDVSVDADTLAAWGITNVVTTVMDTRQSPYAALLSGAVPKAIINTYGEVRMPLPPFTREDCNHEHCIQLLYPGSFQPLHWGHTELARVAGLVMKRYLGNKRVVITYEISVSRVGKKDAHEEDLEMRARQFTETNRRIAITNSKLFIEKAKMFPNHGMIVGIDTARRVIDPAFYNNSQDEMIEAMMEIERCGCYFVVGGRKHGDSWDDPSEMVLPDPIKHLFKPIPPSDFRVDISSTEIRARRMSFDDLSAFQSPAVASPTASS